MPSNQIDGQKVALLLRERKNCSPNPTMGKKCFFGAVDDMWIKLLQYLFTLRYYKSSVWCAKGYIENKNKIIAYLQFCDRYHLNTRWFTKKKKFIMSYMSMTIYYIYIHSLQLYAISEQYIRLTVKGSNICLYLLKDLIRGCTAW